MKGRCVTLVRSCRLTGARERGAGVHTSSYLQHASRGHEEAVCDVGEELQAHQCKGEGGRSPH